MASMQGAAADTAGTGDDGAGAAAAAPAESRPAARTSQLLELSLLRTSWQLLAAHWWQLAIVGLCAYAVHAGLLELAVFAYRAGALPGLLVFSLVPIVPLGAAVGGLLLLRRHVDQRGRAAVFAALGSVLIPFLVVYESQGDFRSDLSDFLLGGFNYVAEQQAAEDLSGGTSDPDAYDGLVLDNRAPLVLAVVVAAFLLRVVGARLVERDRLWQGRPRGLRTTLRVLAGYSEVVWIVIGASVVLEGIRLLRGWWEGRRVGDGVADWWESVTFAFPWLGSVGEWLSTTVGFVLDGVVTGLISPLAWLAIGVIVYGRSVSEAISGDDIIASVNRRNRLASMTRKVNPAVMTLAWRRVVDQEGRFGALIGGMAMVVRSRYVPILVFCVVYTLLVTWLPYTLWQLAYLILRGTFEYADWLALFGPLNAVAYVVGLCLTTPLIAAYADGLLARFGAPSQLRLASYPTAPDAHR